MAFYSSNSIKKIRIILKNRLVNYWTGKEYKKFEKKFSNYNKIKYSVAVSNESVALEIAQKSLRLKSGDKFIVTPRSFIISASIK